MFFLALAGAHLSDVSLRNSSLSFLVAVLSPDTFIHRWRVRHMVSARIDQDMGLDPTLFVINPPSM